MPMRYLLLHGVQFKKPNHFFILISKDRRLVQKGKVHTFFRKKKENEVRVPFYPSFLTFTENHLQGITENF